MKRLIWATVFVAILTAIVVPTVYFMAAARLPTLESEFDVERALRMIIEGERLVFNRSRHDTREKGVTFDRPDFTTLPKDMIGYYISDLGCPTFFQTPREEGVTWAWRVIASSFFNRQLAGDGNCELRLARNIAARLDIKEPLQVAVAAHKLHSFLQKDQLVAYNLEMMQFDPGVIGIRDASRALFKQELDQLSLARLGEMTLALPHNGVYHNIMRCQNPARLREWRNSVISTIAAAGLVAPDRATEAMDELLSCVKKK